MRILLLAASVWCFVDAGTAAAQRMDETRTAAHVSPDSAHLMNPTAGRIILGTFGGALAYAPFWVVNYENGGGVGGVVAFVTGSAVFAALRPSRNPRCTFGRRLGRGLVGAAAGTALSVFVISSDDHVRDYEAVGQVLVVTFTPAIGATVAMGPCRE